MKNENLKNSIKEDNKLVEDGEIFNIKVSLIGPSLSFRFNFRGHEELHARHIKLVQAEIKARNYTLDEYIESFIISSLKSVRKNANKK